MISLSPRSDYVLGAFRAKASNLEDSTDTCIFSVRLDDSSESEDSESGFRGSWLQQNHSESSEEGETAESDVRRYLLLQNSNNNTKTSSKGTTHPVTTPIADLLRSPAGGKIHALAILGHSKRARLACKLKLMKIAEAKRIRDELEGRVRFEEGRDLGVENNDISHSAAQSPEDNNNDNISVAKTAAAAKEEMLAVEKLNAGDSSAEGDGHPASSSKQTQSGGVSRRKTCASEYVNFTRTGGTKLSKGSSGFGVDIVRLTATEKLRCARQLEEHREVIGRVNTNTNSIGRE